MLSSLSGAIINRSELGRSLDTSEVTVKEYLDIAHGSYLWRNVPSFEKSAGKSIVKMPKGIFRDKCWRIGLFKYRSVCCEIPAAPRRTMLRKFPKLIIIKKNEE